MSRSIQTATLNAPAGLKPANPWVATTPELRAGTRMRLFCMPFAGGGSSVFRSWRMNFGEKIEVCPLRLPGREGRIREAPIVDYQRMLDGLASGIEPFTNEPYAIYGHSMGSFLSYELCRRFAATGVRLPRYLFVAARQAPHLFREFIPRPVQQLTDDEFLRIFPRLGGDQMAGLKDPELARLLLPVLRADVQVCQSYPPGDQTPLPIPIAAFGGESDPSVTRGDLEEWSRHTSREFSLHMMPGDHFFLITAAAAMHRTITRLLT